MSVETQLTPEVNIELFLSRRVGIKGSTLGSDCEGFFLVDA